MAQTSAHLKACDIAASETHNKREKDLDYVRKDLTHMNESFSYIDHSLLNELASIKREVKELTGRKLQKNAIPIKEGVIVIDNQTTMQDLKQFCMDCKNRFGIIPLQIHIHRDEGHSRSKDWKPNLHAHIVWRMYDETGRNVRLSRTDLSEMQDIAARCLHMERGKKSNKKHLSSLEYKINQKENQVKTLEEAISRLSDKRTQLEADQTRAQKAKAEIEAFESLTGDISPIPPAERAPEEEWKEFYAGMQAPPFVPIDNLAMMRAPAGQMGYLLKADVCGEKAETKLSYSEMQHIQRGIATRLQMAIYKFHDLLRRKLMSLRMDWDIRKQEILAKSRTKGRTL